MSKFKLKLNTEQNRRRRGWIIRILNYIQHSEGREMNDALLQKTLADPGHRVEMATLHADLRYLEEKGYVGLRKPEAAAFDMLVAWVTAKGVDLYEGAVDDAGIVFREDGDD